MRDIMLWVIGATLQASAALAGLAYLPDMGGLNSEAPKIVEQLEQQQEKNTAQLEAVMGESFR